MNESTPRTNAEETAHTQRFAEINQEVYGMVSTAFARQLERELAELSKAAPKCAHCERERRFLLDYSAMTYRCQECGTSDRPRRQVDGGVYCFPCWDGYDWGAKP